MLNTENKFEFTKICTPKLPEIGKICIKHDSGIIEECGNVGKRTFLDKVDSGDVYMFLSSPGNYFRLLYCGHVIIQSKNKVELNMPIYLNRKKSKLTTNPGKNHGRKPIGWAESDSDQDGYYKAYFNLRLL